MRGGAVGATLMLAPLRAAARVVIAGSAGTRDWSPWLETCMNLDESKRLLLQHRTRRNALLVCFALLLLLFLIRSAAF